MKRKEQGRHVWKTVYPDPGTTTQKRTCQRCGVSAYYVNTGFDRLSGIIYGWRPIVWRCKPENGVK